MSFAAAATVASPAVSCSHWGKKRLLNGVLDWSVGRAMGRQLGTSMAQKKKFGRGKGSSTWLELGGFRSAVHGASVRRVTIIFIRIIIKSNVGEKKV